MTEANEPDDDQAAQLEVLMSETAYHFPDPADAFEDVLAKLLGLTRPDGVSDTEWRRMRVAYIEERDAEAEHLASKAASLADRLISERARQFPYKD